MGELMLQGSGSDVGKSVLVAGLCRVFTNRWLRARPCKPQNISNNAAIIGDLPSTASSQKKAGCRSFKPRPLRKLSHGSLPRQCAPATCKNRQTVMLKTSHTQVNQLLDPDDGNVSIATLQRAAAIIDRLTS